MLLNFNMWKSYSVVLVVVAVEYCCALYSKTSDVVELTAANFQDKVVNSDEPWLVEFYAPWCGHCKSLVPEWNKAATALKGIVNVGAVDMTAHQAVGQPYNVRGFPTIKVFGANKKKPTDYQAARTADAITAEALKAATQIVQERLGGKKSGGGGGGSKSSGGSGGGGQKKGSGKDVVELTDANFDELVLGSEDHWLVEFFAPWCGHCKNLAPEWESAATELKGKVKLGALDSTVHTIVAGKYGIRGYPTIKYFAHGRKNGEAEDFTGGRTSGDIVNWAMDKFAETMPPPELLEITSQEVMDKATANPLCVISVLPDILDTGAAGRNKYLDILRDVADQYKKKGWGWVWTSPGQQTALEDSLGMGGFGYPALAIVNVRKQKFSIFKGSFDRDGIYDFLRSISMGRGSTDSLRKLADIKARDPWDGKDGELPEEEDIDLSDFDMDDEGKDEL
ncbi:protein disulfide-isomerase A6 homolog [Antedon mediterranea]|uniref:protein disulfide-isomerase A6 homolog n=1 Tax=Antedon mediterranea TaxID=105859 RepID=UPI003AF77900